MPHRADKYIDGVTRAILRKMDEHPEGHPQIGELCEHLEQALEFRDHAHEHMERDGMTRDHDHRERARRNHDYRDGSGWGEPIVHARTDGRGARRARRR
jgi:hypothetical protein